LVPYCRSQQTERLAEVEAQLVKSEKKLAKKAAKLKTVIKERAAFKRKHSDITDQLEKKKNEFMVLEKGLSMALQKFLSTAVKDLPPSMIHFRALLDDQLKVLSNKSLSCHWHPSIIEACCAIYSCSKPAYRELLTSGLAMLPTISCIKKNLEHTGTSSTGQDINKYLKLGTELGEEEKWPLKMREVVLIFDEVNTLGILQFKKIGDHFHYFGMVDDGHVDRLFQPLRTTPLTDEEALIQLKSTAALVFQVTFIHDVYKAGLTTEKVLRRVVGVHAVAKAKAEDVEAIRRETIDNLWIYAKVRVVSVVKDGASVNRLDEKFSTSGAGRGSKNTFVTTICQNHALPDDDAVYQFNSDVSHMLKKACTIAYSSSTTSDCRTLELPGHLVEMMDKMWPMAGDDPVKLNLFDTKGIEIYLRLFARLWEILGAGDSLPFYTTDRELDGRLKELDDMIIFIDMWHDYNHNSVAAQDWSPKVKAKKGLTHESFYDMHSCIQGFLNLLEVTADGL
jgi:hypothetical protein